ncbi:uncharacterized protein FSUBG_9441 [Fusarium subglutinans]|uniref:Uncharacterized protein n=1 Tax=Gibberella subglutinans TaxID=42677 RepID=A0A8H5PCW6_GIBSU|nr:uncharacterized protein FSUBG_9441 [Fusarium subglutinans]KAF5594339.1 hypothetical protein FSUBG_9441 [Fusarium subglutinans]
MDERKRDSNNSPSSHALENDRAKRVNTEGSSNAVASTKKQDDHRIIQHPGSYHIYQPLITNEQWNGIVGPKIPLDHGSFASDPNSDTESPWSQTSVRQLTQIMTHSVFRGNMSHLATVIQYAIILRTDDRRPWVMAIRNPTSGGTLARLKNCMNDRLGADGMLQDPVSFLHYLSAPLPMAEKSALLDVMWSLKRIIKFPSTDTPGTLYHFGDPVYHVTATDIKNVQLAIDNSNWDGIPRFPRTSQCHRLFMQRSDKPEGGPDFDQLAEFYCRAWHFEQREIAESSIGRS